RGVRGRESCGGGATAWGRDRRQGECTGGAPVPTAVRLMAAIAIGVVSFAHVATALASSPPAESCTLGIGGSVVSQRQTVLLSTAGCEAPYAASASIGITFASTQVSLGTATADGHGQLSAS